jgi:hypothetical protein
MIKKFLEFAQFSQSQFEPIQSFKLHDKLNPRIWQNFELREDIAEDLMQIAEDHFEFLELGLVKLEDVILTGSVANYNWSEYSDFDLNLKFDFNKVGTDPEFVQKYLDAKKKVWKSQHDITIEGLPVELTCTDINKDSFSTGKYSIMQGEWIEKPTLEEFEPDEEMIRDEASKYMRKIKEIEVDLSSENPDYDRLSKEIKRNLKKLRYEREAGLKREGDLSIENLVYKLLKRNGYVDRLIDAKKQAYDKRYS